MEREILLLGNPQLYEVSSEITQEDFSKLDQWINDLNHTLLAYRKKYGAGRAIALPQIGVKKRMLYMLTEKEFVMINPVLTFPDDEMYEVIDDCMSFPGLCVKVKRHKRANITYFDRNMNRQEMELFDDYSELLQHEYDHLDGILATMRAIDNKSFLFMQMKRDI